jgi:TusA-related sulfurtransferase
MENITEKELKEKIKNLKDGEILEITFADKAEKGDKNGRNS